MSKPFALKTIHELMKTRADDATQVLAKLIASERSAKDKLEMLKKYRDEYADRFQLAAKNGLTPGEWRNYQEFINRIDQTVEAQAQAVALQVQRTASGQTHWQQQRTKLKAFDTLSERHYASENALELKRDQKTQDEFSARSKDDKASG
jgi:flagellar protein FliJ